MCPARGGAASCRDGGEGRHGGSMCTSGGGGRPGCTQTALVAGDPTAGPGFRRPRTRECQRGAVKVASLGYSLASAAAAPDQLRRPSSRGDLLVAAWGDERGGGGRKCKHGCWAELPEWRCCRFTAQA
eukprot:scaffold7471_cov430-Prasinococcus_capsulatus_cf.AAC.6